MAVLHNKGGNSKLLREMFATIVHCPPRLTSNGDLCSGTGSGSGPDSISRILPYVSLRPTAFCFLSSFFQSHHSLQKFHLSLS